MTNDALAYILQSSISPDKWSLVAIAIAVAIGAMLRGAS